LSLSLNWGYIMNTNLDALRQELLSKIIELPESKIKALLGMIDYFYVKKNGDEDPILNVAGCLSGSPISAEEIEKELYGMESF
jgi:hypothetical protein